MRANPAEPVFGISVIRLATVHDGVDQASIGVLDLLRDLVTFVEMIVPKINCCAEQIADGIRGPRSFQGSLQSCVDLRESQCAGSAGIA